MWLRILFFVIFPFLCSIGAALVTKIFNLILKVSTAASANWWNTSQSEWNIGCAMLISFFMGVGFSIAKVFTFCPAVE
jgi:hypothetical protein